MSRWSTSPMLLLFVLAGCGGNESLAVRSPMLATPDTAVRGKNRVYISARSEVVIYKYAQDYYLGKLSGVTDAHGLCTDKADDVYVTDYSAAEIVEFLVGNSNPRRLNDTSTYPIDCSVDPTTGNLAVVNEYGQSEYSAGNVAIYRGAKGKPQIYQYSGFLRFTSCAYDPQGDLLVSGMSSGGQPAFAYLPAGGKSLESMALQTDSGWLGPSYIRWDGKYFVVDFIYNDDFLTFVRYKISKQAGTQEGTMSERIFSSESAPFWVGKIGGSRKQKEANAIAAATTYGVFFWDYPGGTSAFRFYYGIASYGTGITVSAPQ